MNEKQPRSGTKNLSPNAFSLTPVNGGGGTSSRVPQLKRFSRRLISTALCVLVAMPVVPVVPAIAVDKSDATKPAAGKEAVTPAKAAPVPAKDAANKPSAVKETVTSGKKPDATVKEPATASNKAPSAKPTVKAADAEVMPPVAPSFKKPLPTTSRSPVKAADDAAFARSGQIQPAVKVAKPAQSVPSKPVTHTSQTKPTSHSAPPAAPSVTSHPASNSVPSQAAAQQNADSQSSRIARPGMPARPVAGSTAAGSLDNQSSRIARPGLPLGGGVTPHGGRGTPSNDTAGKPAPGTGATGTTAAGKPTPGSAATVATPAGKPPVGGTAATAAPPVAPPVTPPVAPGGTATQIPTAPPNPNAPDDYPAVGSLEQITFGAASQAKPIEQRISTLETAIFAKTYETESLFDRTERLKRTLLGQTENQGDGGAAAGGVGGPNVPGAPGTGYGAVDPSQTLTADPAANDAALADLAYLDEFANKSENLKQEPSNVIEGFALELVNFERRKRNLPPLENDDLLLKMARAHIADLRNSNALSHTGSKGDNPDRRFTLFGGIDAVSESLAAIDSADLGTSRPTKGAVAKSIKRMMMRQDDRETLMSPDASHLAFAMGPNSDGTRVLSCSEVLTKRAVIQPLPHTVRLGEKVEVQGIIMQPYRFDKVTLAWEGKSEDGAVQSYEQTDEALPYFPPLDYVAFKDHSEKDYTKAIATLKTLGMIAAIAGGMFMPPVALAAPLIVMAGPNPEPKPQSDIPVKGSVHVDGQTFTVKVPLSNDSKEGLYYITVWANQGEGSRPVPISRRTIHVTSDEARIAKASQKEEITEDATGEVEPSSPKPNPFLDTPLSQLKAEPKSLADMQPLPDPTGTPKPTDTNALKAPEAAKLSDVPNLPPAPSTLPAPNSSAPAGAPGTANVPNPTGAPPASAAPNPTGAPASSDPNPAGNPAAPIANPQPKINDGAKTSVSGGSAVPTGASNKSELKSDVPEQPTIQSFE